ncbi:MAG: hypothetical protein QXG39_02950 [Candidatus Aenigmatarchaeota archaeon]
MSVREAFYEVLEKKYGIDKGDVAEYKVRRKNVEVLLKNGKTLIFEDPSVVKMAKLSKLDLEGMHKEDLVKQLYGIKVVFEGVNVPYNEFRESYKDKNLEEVVREVIGKEDKYFFSREDKETYREMVKLLVQRKMIESGRGLPIHIYAELDNMTLPELLDYLAKVSR